jgi:hypothetical protein
MLIYKLIGDVYVKMSEKEGWVHLKPLIINDSEFIYTLRECYMSVYNFIDGKDSFPFKTDKDDYTGDHALSVTSYITYKKTDLISTYDAFEIRIWDILTRCCKRVLSSAMSCWLVLPHT